MHILFCIEMSYSIFGVVNSFLAFLYLYLSLAVNFSFSKRERELAYDDETMSDQRRCDIMTSLRHWYNIVLKFKVLCPLRERARKRPAMQPCIFGNFFFFRYNFPHRDPGIL